MKKGRMLFGLLAALMSLTLVGCGGLADLLGSLIKKDDSEIPVTKQLYEEMVDELVAEFGAASRSLAPARSVSLDPTILTPAQLDALRIHARDWLGDGLTSAQKSQADIIAKEMIKAVAAYVADNKLALMDQAGSADLAMVQILSVAAKAAVKSVSALGREDMVSSVAGVKKPIETVIAESTAAVAQTIAVEVVDPEVKSVGLGLAVRSAVEAMEDAPRVTAAKVDAVINATVKEVALEVAATASGTNGAEVQAMLKQASAAVVEAAAASTKTSAAVKAAIVEKVAEETVKAVVEVAATNAALKEQAAAVMIQVVAGLAEEAAKPEHAGLGIGVDASAVAAAVSAVAAGAPGVDLSALSAAKIEEVRLETAPTISTASITAVFAAGPDASTDGEGKLSSATAPTKLRFEASASSAMGVSYAWIKLRGPAQLELQDGSFELSLDQSFQPGVYEFLLKVANVGGTKVSTKLFTLTFAYASPTTSRDYAAGISALKARSWDLAYSKFSAVLADINAPAELANAAKLWKSVLEISRLSVDPRIVALARDKLGFVDYPTSIETLFSDTWLDSDQFYKEEYRSSMTEDPVGGSYVALRFVPDASYPRIYSPNSDPARYLSADVRVKVADQSEAGYHVEHLYSDSRGYFTAAGTPNCYVYRHSLVATPAQGGGWTAIQAYDLAPLGGDGKPVLYKLGSYSFDAPALMPRIAVPSYLDQDLLDKMPAGDALAGRMPNYMIFNIMMANVLLNYGTGLNGAVDAVLAGPVASLKQVVETIASVPDAAEIVLPLDLIESYVDLTFEQRQIAAKFARLTGADLKSFASSLSFYVSAIEMVGAYDLSYDLSSLKALVRDYYNDDGSLKAGMDADGDGFPDAVASFMGTAASPLMALELRSDGQSRLDAAKESFSTGLQLFSAALEGEKARIEDVLPLPPGPEGAEYGAENLVFAIDNAKEFLGTVDAALVSGSAVSIPDELMGNPFLLLAGVYDWAGAGAGTYGIKPAALFAADNGLGALSPRKIFLVADGKFPMKVALYHVGALGREDILPATAYDDSAVDSAYAEARTEIAKAEGRQYSSFYMDLCLTVDPAYVDFMGLPEMLKGLPAPISGAYFYDAGTYPANWDRQKEWDLRRSEFDLMKQFLED